MTSADAALVRELQDESDLCRNEGATDIANLLDKAVSALLRREGWVSVPREKISGWIAVLQHYETANHDGESYNNNGVIAITDELKALLPDAPTGRAG